MSLEDAINLIIAGSKKQDAQYVEVKNLNGTSDKRCVVCGTWIEHWSQQLGEHADKCCCLGCNKDAEVGAHVKKVGKTDMHHYIIPLCQACNMKTESFYVSKDILVSAKKCNNRSES